MTPRQAQFEIPIYQVDAFVHAPFSGNPAAVCLLQQWPADQLLQSIAAENNQPETAFVVVSGNAFEIRWFTPKTEVDICGHATLAAAFVLFLENRVSGPHCIFDSAAGALSVHQESDGTLSLHLPLREAQACHPPPLLEAALGVEAQTILASRDYLVILNNEAQVKKMRPNMELLAEVSSCLGVIVTAPGTHTDYVLRFFSTHTGIPEDQVSGSAHCTLIPYWAKRLGKTRMQARQLSARGGLIDCALLEEQISIRGQARLYMKGTLFI